MPEQQEFPGIGVQLRNTPEKVSSYIKALPIPKEPDVGPSAAKKLRSASTIRVLPMGTPLMLSNGTLVRLIRDVAISKEEFEAIHGKKRKQETRRVASQNLAFWPIELPAESFPVERLEPMQFKKLYADPKEFTRLERREGVITVNKTRCFVYPVTPHEQANGKIRVLGKKRSVLQRPKPQQLRT
ncbi:hypothetical protein HYT33_01585 [Candidatus Roizmanbacteria bacterium]|nr:hypothetical protein [Candidatus Roizmanbacteria bacterium]